MAKLFYVIKNVIHVVNNVLNIINGVFNAFEILGLVHT